MKAPGFKVEILYVVHYRMPEHKAVVIFQESADERIHRREGRMLFEFRIVVRKFQTLFALSVGEVKAALWIYEDIFLFYDIELLVAHDVAEGAYLCRGLVHAGAFDIEKD